MKRAILTTLAALLLVVFFADSAAAQRRRRRRRRRPPPQETTQAEEPTTEEGASADGEAAAPAESETGPAGDPSADEGSDEASAEGETGPGAPGDVPSTEPTPELDPGPAPPDVSPIREEYVTLMDDLVQARMRVSALGAELFRTRIQVNLQDLTAGRQQLARMVVHLDGAGVFQSDGPVENAANGREIFTGSLAPGPHVLTLEVEQRARDNDAYRYTLRESFRFDVTRERLSEVTLILEDSSDIATSFPAGGEGRYEVRTRMRVATRALPAGN